MARVWRARDRLLQRNVVLKQITGPPGSTQTGPDTLQLAMREARAAAQVTHPGAARIYDVVDDAAGPCIVMEYVPRPTLHEIVERHGLMAAGFVASVGG